MNPSPHPEAAGIASIPCDGMEKWEKLDGWMDCLNVFLLNIKNDLTNILE